MMTEWPFEIALTPEQDAALRAYGRELTAINRRFNLISRQDEAHVLDRHIAHCLALAVRGIEPGTRVIDWGTGGGLPAIPLAILHPQVHFTGVDSNQKKTRSVDLFARRLGLGNVSSLHERAESVQISTQLSVSRATAPLATLWGWHEAVAEPERALPEGVWADGLLCLKGGDLAAEIEDLHASWPDLEVERIPLRSLTRTSYFATKEMVHVSRMH